MKVKIKYNSFVIELENVKYMSSVIDLIKELK